MFAKKLGRVARLVLVLAVVFGGVGVAAGCVAESHTATPFGTLSTDWCSASCNTVFVAETKCVSVAADRPVFKFRSNLGKLLLLTSSRKR